jgi:hypothetical protein
VDKHLVLFTASHNNPRKRYDLAKEAVNALNDPSNVELIRVTETPYQLVPLYMNACDVLLLTSLHEGSPNVVKEALACTGMFENELEGSKAASYVKMIVWIPLQRL